MAIPTRSFTEFVDAQISAIQASYPQLIDFNTGSVLSAIVESNAGNSLWIQALITQVLAICRLTTSSGTDVDTFVNPFGFFRKDAEFAEGNVTFKRFTPSNQAIVPARNPLVPGSGAQVSSSAANQNYIVIINESHPLYNPTLVAYVIPIGLAQADIPVQANVGGSAGNVAANLINTLNTVIIGIDQVFNTSAMQGGTNIESDASVKARFPLYLNSLSKATSLALMAAIESVDGVKRFNLVENKSFPSGSFFPGFFYVVVDDGTGSPPTLLLNKVGEAVNQVRAFTISYAIYPPSPLTITAEMTLTVSSTAVHATITDNIKNAITNYVNNFNFGQTLPYTEIATIAYNSLPVTGIGGVQTLVRDPNILNVTGVTLNGGTSDIIPTSAQIFITNTSNIIVNYV